MRVALVVPAHSEAMLIAEAVRGLAGHADALYVIADHCADATAELARNAGARVYERREGPGGKGAALAWFFEVAGQELSQFDLVVVVDADSRLGEGFAPAMKDAFARGALAAQGFVCPVCSGRSSAPALAAYSELLSQRIGDKIRARLGWSVPLRGTGMAFRPSVLAGVVRDLRTRTEDIEMSLRLALGRVRVRFVPGAVVYDPKPASAAQVSRQRARWLQGQLQVWCTCWRDILRLALSGGPNAWSLLWALLAKPKALLTAGKALLLAGVFLLVSGSLWLRALLLAILGLGVAIDAIYYLVGLALVDDRRFYGRVLLLSPLYVAVWLWSIVLAQVSGGTWLRARD
ncbi:MAG: glycosyltransferase [Anaerolineae bacterium]|nr:glycosyltransferase [Anaerolineae bacterium]